MYFVGAVLYVMVWECLLLRQEEHYLNFTGEWGDKMTSLIPFTHRQDILDLSLAIAV